MKYRITRSTKTNYMIQKAIVHHLLKADDLNYKGPVLHFLSYNYSAKLPLLKFSTCYRFSTIRTLSIYVKESNTYLLRQLGSSEEMLRYHWNQTQMNKTPPQQVKHTANHLKTKSDLLVLIHSTHKLEEP